MMMSQPVDVQDANLPSQREQSQIMVSGIRPERVLRNNDNRFKQKRKNESKCKYITENLCTPKLIIITVMLALLVVIGWFAVYGTQKKGYDGQKDSNNPSDELQKQLTMIEVKIKSDRTEIASIQKDITGLKKQLSSIKNEIQVQKQKLDSVIKITNSKKPKGTPSNIENPGEIIDIDYSGKAYLPLPIDIFRKDENGRSIADVLYSSEEERRKREKYHLQRKDFVDAHPTLDQLYFVKYNMAINEEQRRLGVEVNQQDWVRLNSKFRFEDVKQELPMCIIVTGINNNVNSRIEYNLNSIFAQNYTDYKVVVVDDGSNDGSRQIYRKYFAFHRIDKERYVYIENKKRATALPNIYSGVMNHCGGDSVSMVVDADDELIGRNVLKVLNAEYQHKKAGVLYSNFYSYQQGKLADKGWTTDYSAQDKKNSNFRHFLDALTPYFSQLRTYRTELFYRMDVKDLQDRNGAFLTITYDVALTLPMMELSCGRVHKIEGEIQYLYNSATGNNDGWVIQGQVARDLYSRPKRECWKEFDEKMRN